MNDHPQKSSKPTEKNPSQLPTPQALTVEYLIILTDGDSFCDGVETFNRLLRVDSSIAIKGGKLTHAGSFSCDYKIAAGEVTGRSQRYFQVQLSSLLDQDAAEAAAAVDQFIDLLKTVRAVISKTGAQVETLWDGVSLFYSRKAYSIFYRLENTMRKLIANFMLTTVGKEWVSETSPAEIREALSKSKRKDYVNVLHSVDFIHLADFLVKPYSKIPTKELYAKIRTAKTIEDIERLRTDLPTSNWQRYFASLVKCEDSFLQKRWENLYELRCMVAHNAIFTRTDFLRTCELADELLPLLENALQKLPQVTVPSDERETVAESAATTLSSLVGDFIGAWRIIERHLNRLTGGTERRLMTVLAALAQLQRTNSIDPELANKIRQVSSFRNQLVHNTGASFSEQDVQDSIRASLSIIETLKIIPEAGTPDVV